MNTARGIYVTGTDTGVGKTLAAAALVHRTQQAGLRVAAMKPVASGSRATASGWRNEDAEALIGACAGPLDYSDVNPYALEEPTAPEIAAALQSVDVDVAVLEQAYARLAAAHDRVVVEGVGGWEAPLARGLLQADLCRRLQLPVVMVVGLRLGCISHARLTQRAIRDDGMRMAGWVVSMIDPAFAHVDATLQLLQRDLAAPCLGVFPHEAAPDPLRLAGALELPAF